MGDLEPVYDPLTITSELTLPESATQTRGNTFVEQVEFSYGESPRTPPLEGTSLHRRNTSVERPWGILSLFTTCLRLRVNRPCQRLWHRHGCGSFVEQVVFLTMNHRGPLPLRELHSTDETLVWRDPGGSWACLRPVSDLPCQRLWHRHVWGVFVEHGP